MSTEASDPTHVELATDPLTNHITGWTRHKNLRIDCPIITPIAENLYMGGTDESMVLPAEVDYLLSLYQWGSYKIKHKLKGKLVITMYDAEGDVDRDSVLELANWVHERRQDGNVLVVCQAGLNRSGLVTATALVLGGLKPREAVDLLREKRSPAVLCNQSFEDFVLGFKA